MNNTQRYIVAVECGCDYAWVIDTHIYNNLPWYSRWWNPTQASVYGTHRKLAHQICDELNMRDRESHYLNYGNQR